MSTSISLRSPKVLLAFACIYVIWGTTYLGIALTIESLPPFFSGALRFVSAAALMYLWLRLRSPRPLRNVNWLHAAICGVLLTGLGNGLVIWAQQGVPSGIAALVVASIPVFVLAIDWCFFQKRPPSPAAIAGLALAVIGVATIVTHTRSLSGQAQPLHIVALLCAVCAWSLGTLLQKRWLRSDVFAFTCAQIFCGGLAQGLFSMLNREWRVLDLQHVSGVSIAALAYLILFGSIVAFNCYAWLLSRVPAQMVATYAVVNPVVAVFLGAWLLSEPVTAMVMGSVLLVLIGVSLVLFQDRIGAWVKRDRLSELPDVKT